ncbi:MAG: hypothetical protein HQM10_03025 [Candidatus Riflebacteria bacterium]|nr:hypothetical protein [Candidatus Riflebacteria bacterium]
MFSGKKFFFLFTFLFCIGITSSWLISDQQKVIEQINSASTKNISMVKLQNGPAWVKVTLKPASEDKKLICGNQPCLWKKSEGIKTVIEDLRRGGKWIQRATKKKFEEEPQSVPFIMEDETGSILMNDWLGIEIGQDLMKLRFENPSAKAPGETEDSDKAEYRKDSYLPENSEAWALGGFENGKPTGYINGVFYLTSLGPERFSTNQKEGIKSLYFLSISSKFLAGLLLAIFVYKKYSNRNNATIDP